MTDLVLKNVYKVYNDGTVAVNNFNLVIKNGEFVILVGPSGCGKSTTLRMIAGLEDITAGSFYISGVKANALEPKDRNMAMVFQNYALYPHMNVYENMAFGLRINKVPKQEIDQRVTEAAEILGLTSQLAKKPKDMSGGQRQRVALGRAIVRNPSVFLLDEPLSNLDAKLRASMRSEIRRLHDALKTTFIYVTHDQIEAMTMGTKIVVMDKGLIQQVDSPMNLYDYPENLFVAGFIGSPQMNIFDGICQIVHDEIMLKIGKHLLKFPLKKFPKIDVFDLANHEAVKIGIRPEHLSLASRKEKNTIPLDINLIEALGNETVCEGLIAATDINIIAKITRNNEIREGDTIHLKLEADKIHLFSSATQATLNPRMPHHSFVKYSEKLFGKKVSFPKAYEKAMAQMKDPHLLIPLAALEEGKQYALKILKQERIQEEVLLTLQGEDGQTLFAKRDQEVKGKTYSFNLRPELISITDGGQVVFAGIPRMNTITGKLIPHRRRITMDGKSVNKKVFDYAIKDVTYRPNDEIVAKIYALLGKKFALHTIDFSFAPDAVTFSSQGMKGIIQDIIQYSPKLRFAVIDVAGDQVYVKIDEDLKIDQEVFLDINPDDFGVYDVNFDVIII
jgi:multiple sugar transport system ATP-binding protein